MPGDTALTHATAALTTAPERLSRSPFPSGRHCHVLGMRVDELNYGAVINQIRAWGERQESRYMCISTVHMVMESYRDPAFRQIINTADLVGADGIPVIKVSRHLGLSHQERVFAPELVIKYAEVAEQEGVPVGFYGSTPSVIADIQRNLQSQFPKLRIAYSLSPPFRALTEDETSSIAADINASGARVIFVGLGCPKQERWMSMMRGKVMAPMIGVGWAFDVCAGHSRAAPAWIQNAGMEWFYRLLLNPRKLWRRHLINNPQFLYLIARQLVTHRGG